ESVLGYTDFHVGFFVVLTLVLLTRPLTWTNCMIAGLPLGVTALLKPQAEGLIAMTVLFLAAAAVLGSVSRRSLVRLTGLLVAPIVFFGGYSLYFASHGHSLRYLAHTYSPNTLRSLFPALTANMLNLWYPLANHERAPGAPIWTVQ